MKKVILFLLMALLFTSCEEKVRSTAPIQQALASPNTAVKNVFDSLSKYEVQIKFTRINRKNDSIFFKDYTFQDKPENYFYPASTVKLPISLLALEKLNRIDDFDMNTVFYIENDSIETTVAKEITKIFAVSDNEAYNRLFEFLGQNEINIKLHKKGIENVRIAHRLSILDADNVTTNPLVIYLNDSTLRLSEKIINKSITPLEIENTKKGKGFYDEDDVLINEAFDFNLKNYYAVDAQHEVLKRIIFPEKFKKEEQFNLNETQREFVLNAMSSLPKKAGYTSDEYYDSYVKFFLFGDSKEDIPKHIKIYNKVGYAYGTLTDCAYIKDTKNNIEFLLTATILVNKNGIFNDNTYEYDSIGIPFLAALGRELYHQELEVIK
ncbi:class A beta-lactamase-related serine hydrolase [Cellulophaga baltica]|uniref:serine hydrolase n=1 Tax=Cellulophaga TaxID=104264 RepID=UPI001C07AFEC|nr:MULTISPECIES: serine hydrolase [Cellulophaga]MBU2998035.1 class A beta-lactamase-related serine hydrolase [Cellulophaga baltica]MDO6769436.1 serine hydrolase [Cellulophaga sp. 1_MG-2023]